MKPEGFFDEEKWVNAATQREDWYNLIFPEFEAILAKYEVSPLQERKAARNAIYGLFEGLLDQKKVILGASGTDWDRERKPVDTIVIHHTKVESGMTLGRLDAMILLRLYARSYFSPTSHPSNANKPIWSNHFRVVDGEKRMTFHPYHWFIRTDGTAERLLDDDKIGWQAGNWEVNCRSVAICLDGDFEHSAPPEIMIERARSIIDEYYPHVSMEKIFPHREINKSTSCPGEWYRDLQWK